MRTFCVKYALLDEDRALSQLHEFTSVTEFKRKFDKFSVRIDMVHTSVSQDGYERSKIKDALQRLQYNN